MPPKRNKQQQQGKKKDNVDKTFGMKNKNRSTKVQRYIKQVEQQGADPAKEEMRRRKAEEKFMREAQEAERRLLFNNVADQRVRAGVDPKTVVCALFKMGNCNKGSKCKFSHDLNVGRRVEKKDLYQDARQEKEQDTMDNWDEEKLRKVILSKHGNPKTTTDKVCKYFIEAVENGKYGWFWICPNNGDKCMYKHSLPEGFELKTKEQRRLEKEALDNQPKITLEEFIETERGYLDKTKLTPITIENFAEWKKSHVIAKINAEKKLNEKRKPTGREIIQKLSSNGSILIDEDNAATNDTESLYSVGANEEQGSAWDLTEFTDALREADHKDDSGIKDYGDGSNPTFEIKTR
ncbi:Translation machinery-associated protein 46 [Maudiozyma exigua]|uniref:Translation machinery-associated protein 46 n=1 Tax=Maudiozyma exigua TaxID=34358 RepID=A0A9P7BDL1_MAUEX|nr:Translation machinery-associated protein 46 [Kazachstania exigua]